MKRLFPTLAAIVVAVVLLSAAEGALRLIGFSREIAPITLQFGYPNPREIIGLFRFDPRLFWRLRPGSVFEAEAAVPINRLGYRGREPQEPRPAGLVRIAVLGDSVAFGAATAWPDFLEARMTPGIAPRPVEVLNFGVPGYTVVQGLRQFEDEVARLRPDAVVIAYGWNDHWLARGGLSDDALPVPSRWRSVLSLQLSRLRLAQAVQAVAARFSPDPPSGVSTPAAVRRVPAEDYAAHMERLIEETRAAGATPIVVGLPSALTEKDYPAYLVEGGFTPSARDAVADHTHWAQVAGEAARKAGVVFVDGQPGYSLDGTPDAALFTRDRIHLSARGQARMVELLEDTVLDALKAKP